MNSTFDHILSKRPTKKSRKSCNVIPGESIEAQDSGYGIQDQTGQENN